MDSRSTLAVNTLLDGAYRIERVVGAGGFGITYQAEDIKLRTRVALKEYYPLDFGDRDRTMSVRPKSDRHAKTFEWGRSNFLQEARTLARFEHPNIVRVTRVFEANSTAYMVMRFEQGQSLDDWLTSLGRPPTQEELDRIVEPILDALQMLHAQNFLHRDIAPDNIIVRADGSPVLLDFGAARRAVAEMSRTLTGVVKAGYSPHEQYSSDSRLQGPWSDLFALGGTLYRAVTLQAPEEVALRVDQDQMPPAVAAAKGKYRPEFLEGIDACLKVRHSERPRSVAQLRPMLLGDPSGARHAPEPSKPRTPVSVVTSTRKVATPQPARSKRWFAAAAGFVALLGGAYGGIAFMRWQPSVPTAVESRRQAADEAARRQANAEAERRLEEEAKATAERRQADADRKNREENEAAARRQANLEAERQRQDEVAAAARKQEEADAEARRKEESERVAAADARRVADEDARRKTEEEARVAALTLTADQRVTFVRQVQQTLKQGGCYEGATNGHLGDTQESLDQFVANASKKGKARMARIELAKANRADFEAWLQDAGDLKGDVCAPKPRPSKHEAAKPRREEVAKPARRREEDAPRRRAERPNAEPKEPSGSSSKLCWGYRSELVPCKN